MKTAAGPRTRKGAARRATPSAPRVRRVTSTAGAVAAARTTTTSPAARSPPSPMRTSPMKNSTASGGCPATCVGQLSGWSGSIRATYSRSIAPMSSTERGRCRGTRRGARARGRCPAVRRPAPATASRPGRCRTPRPAASATAGAPRAGRRTRTRGPRAAVSAACRGRTRSGPTARAAAPRRARGSTAPSPASRAAAGASRRAARAACPPRDRPRERGRAALPEGRPRVQPRRKRAGPAHGRAGRHGSVRTRGPTATTTLLRWRRAPRLRPGAPVPRRGTGPGAAAAAGARRDQRDRGRQRVGRRHGRRGPGPGRPGGAGAATGVRRRGARRRGGRDPRPRRGDGRRRLLRPARPVPLSTTSGAAPPTSPWGADGPWRAASGPGTRAPATRWSWRCLRRRGFPAHDIAPIRVCRRERLLALGVEDRRFGYPVELLQRATSAGWRISEHDVAYHPRAAGTRSKVSGSVRGTVRTARDFWRVLA